MAKTQRNEEVAVMAVVDGVNNMLFKFTGPSAASFNFPSNFTTSKIKIAPNSDDQTIATEYMPWGSNNDQPNLVLAETGKNAYATSLLENNIIPYHYGRGVLPVREDTVNGGYKLAWDADIKLFWRICDVPRLQKQIVHDFEWMKNYFPEFILDKTGRKIGYVKRHAPFNSRWEKQNDKGDIKHLFVSADFPNNPQNTVAEIKNLDYDLPFLDFLNRSFKSGDSFTRQFALRTRDKVYYDEAGWHALILSWLPIANAVPEIKKKIIEFEMTIKYQIEVPMEYFRRKAELDGHAKLTPALMTKYFTEFKDMMNSYLSGQENAGKSFITPTDYYVKNGKETWHIKIIAIKDELKDAAHLSDNYQANVEIAQGMGMDVALTGRTKGGSEDGSGSSKFQAHTINEELQHYRREQTLSWLYFVKQVNGWADDIEFMYGDFGSLYNNTKQNSLPENKNNV